MPQVAEPYRLKRERSYGKIKLTLYERGPDA
jgi:hypothetical protein